MWEIILSFLIAFVEYAGNVIVFVEYAENVIALVDYAGKELEQMAIEVAHQFQFGLMDKSRVGYSVVKLMHACSLMHNSLSVLIR